MAEFSLQALFLISIAFTYLYKSIFREKRRVYIRELMKKINNEYFNWLERLLLLGAISYIIEKTANPGLSYILFITVIILFFYFVSISDEVGDSILTKIKINKLYRYPKIKNFIEILFKSLTILIGFIIMVSLLDLSSLLKN